MAYKLKEEATKPERFTGGHRLCAGCGAGVAVRGVLRALKPEDRAVCGVATSCLEVSSYLYPYTSWKDSYIHTAFENVGATISGAEACYQAMKRKGTMGKETYKFIAWGGDGGTYDIGFQSLSGAMERNHDMVYVCYDNEAYMNTGIQRSSATPAYADVSTAPAGSEIPGKREVKKDLTAVLVAHNIPYVGQTTFWKNFSDLHEKSERALYTPGAAFLNILAPCPRGWRYANEDLIEICRLAVETCVWPLYEVIDGEWKLSYEPKNKLPVEDYLKPQGRFSHMFKPGNEGLIAKFQKDVDKKWENLLKKCK
ncbi:MAG: thiamine pyrophosphate-dependent enzyme [Spirochaetes bacterium]|nr:thiamine pyrophosphate-dependent enzyme [Spirochaetota bacterium]